MDNAWCSLQTCQYTAEIYKLVDEILEISLTREKRWKKVRARLQLTRIVTAPATLLCSLGEDKRIHRKLAIRRDTTWSDVRNNNKGIIRCCVETNNENEKVTTFTSYVSISVKKKQIFHRDPRVTEGCVRGRFQSARASPFFFTNYCLYGSKCKPVTQSLM